MYKLDDIDKYLEENISKLINYIINFEKIATEINIIEFNNTNIKIFYNMFLLLLNYGISKYDNIKKIFKPYESLFLLKFDDIYKFRETKYKLFN